MNIYEEKRRILITAPRYVAKVTTIELEELGYEFKTEKDNAISIRGTFKDALYLNLWLRTAHKVLFHLFDGVANDLDEFYDLIRGFAWEEWIPENGYISIQSAAHNDTIRDTRLPNMKAKDAIVDRMFDLNGFRPDSGSDLDNTVLFVYWNRQKVSVFIDTSGVPLSRRGYRHQPHLAPLQETLAAALIYRSGWDPKTHFVNPMCGSGTLAIEAFLIGTNTAPGLFRENFGFKHILQYDESVWNELVANARSVQLPTTEGMIIATDIDPEAIEAAKGNADRANVGAHIMFRVCDFRDTMIPVGKGAVMMNPEYGERLGKPKALEKIYAAMGSLFKRRCQGYTCHVVSSSPELLEHIRLQSNSVHKFFNSNLDVELVSYEIFENKVEEETEIKPKRVLRSRK